MWGCFQSIFVWKMYIYILYTNKHFNRDYDAALQGLTGYITCVIPTWPMGTPIGSFHRGGSLISELLVENMGNYTWLLTFILIGTHI